MLGVHYPTGLKGIPDVPIRRFWHDKPVSSSVIE